MKEYRMPMFTYMDNAELELGMREIEDKDIKDLLEEIRELDSRFYVTSRTYTNTKGFFRKTVETSVIYNVFIRIDGCEVQELNIGKSRGNVLAYMYGYLNGLNATVLV